MDNKARKIKIVFYLCIFIFLCVFYLVSHPLILNSPDDWIYAQYNRIGLPIPMNKLWNPSRIFPETVMSIIADIGAFIINPIIGDYIQSIAVALGLFVAIVVFLYFRSFGYYLRNKCQVDNIQEVVVVSFFILSHYLIFRTVETRNICLMLTVPNLYYFYLLPAFINFTLIFLFEAGIIDRINAEENRNYKMFKIGIGG